MHLFLPFFVFFHHELKITVNGTKKFQETGKIKNKKIIYLINYKFYHLITIPYRLTTENKIGYTN